MLLRLHVLVPRLRDRAFRRGIKAPRKRLEDELVARYAPEEPRSERLFLCGRKHGEGLVCRIDAGDIFIEKGEYRVAREIFGLAHPAERFFRIRKLRVDDKERPAHEPQPCADNDTEQKHGGAGLDG